MTSAYQVAGGKKSVPWSTWVRWVKIHRALPPDHTGDPHTAPPQPPRPVFLPAQPPQPATVIEHRLEQLLFHAISMMQAKDTPASVKVQSISAARQISLDLEAIREAAAGQHDPAIDAAALSLETKLAQLAPRSAEPESQEPEPLDAQPADPSPDPAPAVH